MTTNLFSLEGKIALVTGASRGIGEEIARLLAEQGAHVIVSSRKLEDCEAVASEINNAGGSAEAKPCHVGRVEDILAIFQHIRARHGRLDILVNNAATNPYFGHILDTDLASFEKTVEVNLSRIYHKLGVHSRIELFHVMNTAPGLGTAASDDVAPRGDTPHDQDR